MDNKNKIDKESLRSFTDKEINQKTGCLIGVGSGFLGLILFLCGMIFMPYFKHGGTPAVLVGLLGFLLIIAGACPPLVFKDSLKVKDFLVVLAVTVVVLVIAWIMPGRSHNSSNEHIYITSTGEHVIVDSDTYHHLTGN